MNWIKGVIIALICLSCSEQRNPCERSQKFDGLVSKSTKIPRHRPEFEGTIALLLEEESSRRAEQAGTVLRIFWLPALAHALAFEVQRSAQDSGGIVISTELSGFSGNPQKINATKVSRISEAQLKLLSRLVKDGDMCGSSELPLSEAEDATNWIVEVKCDSGVKTILGQGIVPEEYRMLVVFAAWLSGLDPAEEEEPSRGTFEWNEYMKRRRGWSFRSRQYDEFATKYCPGGKGMRREREGTNGY